MPHKALAKIFRAKLRDAFKKADAELFAFCAGPQNDLAQKLGDRYPACGHRKDSTEISRAIYLPDRHLQQADHKIENGQVTFRYQDNKGKWHTRTLDAEAFIARFLQHVLPKRLQKVRYYGLFSSRKRHLLTRVKELFNIEFDEEQASCAGTEERLMRCPRCGEVMVFVREITPQKIMAP